jgi:hypothetical protein
MMSPPKDPESSNSERTPLVGTTKTKGELEVTSTNDVENNELDLGKPQIHSLSEDIIDTFKLGLPIFIAMLSWVGVRKR